MLFTFITVSQTRIFHTYIFILPYTNQGSIKEKRSEYRYEE